MLKKDITYGILGGVGLYLPLIFTSYLLYLPVFDKMLDVWFLISVLIGGTFSVFTIIFKNHSVKHAFIRTLILFVSNFFTTAFNGGIGTIRLLDKLLGIENSEATSRAAGLAMVLFLIGVLGICIVTNVVIAIINLIRFRSTD